MDQDSLDAAVVSALRKFGADLLLTSEARLEEELDERLLRTATGLGRTIFTANVADFARLHVAWANAGQVHAGIVVRTEQRMPIGDQVKAIRRVMELFSQEYIANQFLYLENYR